MVQELMKDEEHKLDTSVNTYAFVTQLESSISMMTEIGPHDGLPLHKKINSM